MDRHNSFTSALAGFLVFKSVSITLTATVIEAAALSGFHIIVPHNGPVVAGASITGHSAQVSIMTTSNRYFLFWPHRSLLSARTLAAFHGHKVVRVSITSTIGELQTLTHMLIIIEALFHGTAWTSLKWQAADVLHSALRLALFLSHEVVLVAITTAVVELAAACAVLVIVPPQCGLPAWSCCSLQSTDCNSSYGFSLAHAALCTFVLGLKPVLITSTASEDELLTLLSGGVKVPHGFITKTVSLGHWHLADVCAPATIWLWWPLPWCSGGDNRCRAQFRHIPTVAHTRLVRHEAVAISLTATIYEFLANTFS
jgi:hypothetical protein